MTQRYRYKHTVEAVYNGNDRVTLIREDGSFFSRSQEEFECDYEPVPDVTAEADSVVTREQQCEAADYAGNLDYDARARMVDAAYAEETKIQLSLGAFRAFEWLENNGFKVITPASKGDA